MKLCPKCHKQFSDDANFCPVCAARLQPIVGGGAGADSLATRFELGAPLGGMRTGPVYKAVDKTNGDKAVAIKIVAPAVIALPGVAQRLERELKQLERVSSAGVAKVLASGKRTASNGNEETWVAVEVLDGAQTLAQAIGERGAIAVAEAAQLVEVIGEALIEAAQVGVVHRDLAPKNVLFAGSDVKLINFSLPVPTSEKTPGVSEFVAPEQIEGKPVDQRSNLYSLGALYYYVLTGKTLASGEGPAQLQLGSAVPPAVEALIVRALDKSPTKRFLTVRQFVDEVGRVARGEGDNVKSTMPLGKVAGQSKPRAELVQTLLGVRLSPGSGGVPVTPAVGGAPIASAPTVGGISALQPSVLAAPVQAMAATAPAPIIAAATPAAVTVQAAPAPAAAPAPIVPAPDVPVPTPNAPSPISSTVVGLSGGVMVAPAPSTSPAPAPSPEAAPAPAPAATLAMSPAERSPWAPAPAAAAAAPAAAAPAPAPAAPVLAKPVVAAARAEAPAGGKKKAGAEEKKAQKGKFRETMWFKKGELDAAAADSAAQERMRTGKDAGGDKADSLPIDERYKDDGSLSTTDANKYSLRTGGTQMMAKITDRGGGTGGDGVSDDALIGEMKSGRNTIIIVIGVAIVVIILIVVLFAR